jgi:hypothetical protein
MIFVKAGAGTDPTSWSTHRLRRRPRCRSLAAPACRKKSAWGRELGSVMPGWTGSPVSGSWGEAASTRIADRDGECRQKCLLSLPWFPHAREVAGGFGGWCGSRLQSRDGRLPGNRPAPSAEPCPVQRRSPRNPKFRPARLLRLLARLSKSPDPIRRIHRECNRETQDPPYPRPHLGRLHQLEEAIDFRASFHQNSLSVNKTGF